MYFLYVDESGDPGAYDPNQAGGATRHYILSGLIVPVVQWRNYLSSLVEIRRYIKQQYGIGMRVELKGATIIHPRGDPLYAGLTRHRRAALYRDALNLAADALARSTIFSYAPGQT